MDYIIYSFDGNEYMTVNQIKDFIENNAVVGYDIDAEINDSIRRLSSFKILQKDFTTETPTFKLMI